MKISIKSVVPVLLLVGIVGLVGYVLSRQHQNAVPDGLVFTNGRLESERVAVASKVPGRIVAMLKQEGDSVKSGEVIAKLDDSQVVSKVDQAKAAIAAIEAQLAARKEELSVARREAPLGVAASEAQRQRASAQAMQTSKDAERYANLRKEGVIDAHHAEQAQLAAVAATTQLDQAERQLSMSRLAIDKVKAGETALLALVAQRDAAQAQLREAQTALDETLVKAPLDGVVAIRAREPGEVVGAGSTLFELYDPNQVYLRAYVAETDIGKIKLGLPAQIWVDAYPGRPFDAVLSTIASRAEFTPKEVQTHDERAKQVFGIKLLLKVPSDARLAPGLPADASIRYKDGVRWQAPT